MIGTELEMDGGEVAKLRIWKEKDFNITKHGKTKCVYLKKRNVIF